MEGCGCITLVTGKGTTPSIGAFGSLRIRFDRGSSDRLDGVRARFEPTGGASSWTHN